MINETLVLTKLDAVKRHVLGLKEIARAGPVTKLPIAEIAIGERLIPEDPRVVAQLVISIQQTRQLTPVLVRRTLPGGHMLVDGLNRIAALKQLGETEVLASVLDMTSDEEANACEAISNSHRRQKLTALDRALTDVAFLQYVEKKVVQDAAPRGGRQPREKCQAKTARELGVSPDQIARSCKIAKLDPSVQRQVRELNLEDKQSMLLEIASSGDDRLAQLLTLGRIKWRIELAKSAPALPAEASSGTLASAWEGAQTWVFPSSNSESSMLPVRTESNSNVDDSRSAVSKEGEIIRTLGHSSPQTGGESQDDSNVSSFETIKREWENAEPLRQSIDAGTEEDKKRFLNECVMPALGFSQPDTMATVTA